PLVEVGPPDGRVELLAAVADLRVGRLLAGQDGVPGRVPEVEQVAGGLLAVVVAGRAEAGDEEGGAPLEVGVGRGREGEGREDGGGEPGSAGGRRGSATRGIGGGSVPLSPASGERG